MPNPPHEFSTGSYSRSRSHCILAFVFVASTPSFSCSHSLHQISVPGHLDTFSLAVCSFSSIPHHILGTTPPTFLQVALIFVSLVTSGLWDSDGCPGSVQRLLWSVLQTCKHQFTRSLHMLGGVCSLSLGWWVLPQGAPLTTLPPGVWVGLQTTLSSKRTTPLSQGGRSKSALSPALQLRWVYPKSVVNLLKVLKTFHSNDRVWGFRTQDKS